jgi:Mrp family chromosome partitioning ATPase
MTKIFEALTRAGRERSERDPDGGLGFGSFGDGDPQVREKLLGMYRTLVATKPDGVAAMIAFVGLHVGSGTSTLAREFVKLAGAELGQRVALLDGEQGFGGHGEHFGVDLKGGCEDVLGGQANLDDVCCSVSDASLFLANLADPGTSLAAVSMHPRFEALMDTLRSEFDLVVIDLPPLDESSDALAVAAHTDGVVLVLEAEKTRWQVAANATERIAMAGAKVLGAILNRRKDPIPQAIYDWL